MKHLYITILLCLTASFSVLANDFANENINYKVMYKWGLINKQAGSVDISLKVNPDNYQALLTASSASWADHLYRVRDTLWCEMMRPSLEPTYYRKHAHEEDDENYDEVIYTREGSKVIGESKHVNYRKGKLRKDERITLKAVGTTLDMLTAYYYMRQIPYDQWEIGQVVSVNIFSGKKKELLTIKYHGLEEVKYDKKTYNCYKITFTFTSDNKKKSSDDMSAWIETGPQHIPVKLEGKLPVGSIKCFYTGQ